MKKYFDSRVLPFGLSSACHLFTMMFKPLVAQWRSLGILYIDDSIFGCRILSDAQSLSKLVKSDLLNSGWRCNEKKSNWELRQLGGWLGVIIDTARMLFVVPEKKIVKLKSILTELINDFSTLKVRRVVSVSGFVISLSVALGPVPRLFFHVFFHQLEGILERCTCRKRRSFTRIEILVSSC